MDFKKFIRQNKEINAKVNPNFFEKLLQMRDHDR